jgi:hypothetical protein
MAAAHGELPTILKNRAVDFTTSKGRTNYQYEDLSSVTQSVSPIFSKHGLSFRWRTNSDKPGAVSVTCIIAHAGGHSEETTLACQADVTGNKNDIQAIGSAVTYLQRYTLKAACGIAASVDDDGHGRTAAPPTASPARSYEAPTAKPYDGPKDHQGDTRLITTQNRDAAPGDKKLGGQLGRLFAILKKSGRDADVVKTWLKVRYGFESSKEITREKYDEICAQIEAPGALMLTANQTFASLMSGGDDPTDADYRESGEEG